MDLSASINRIRFDGLAAGVYRKIGDAIKATAADAGLDLVQIDEVSTTWISLLNTYRC
jgi:heat shock protein 1/8